MPKLGDSRRVRASAKENELSQRLYGAATPPLEKPFYTALASCVQVQKRRALYDSSVVLLGSSYAAAAAMAGADIETNKGVIFISHFL